MNALAPSLLLALTRGNISSVTVHDGATLERWLEGKATPRPAPRATAPVPRARPARVESWSPSSNWVPPWQDKTTLCMCLCISENTVDTWVRQGLLPPPRKRGGKLMWKWNEVEKYLEGDEPQSSEQLAESIRNATRKAATSDQE
jgi:hypothetical protein